MNFSEGTAIWPLVIYIEFLDTTFDSDSEWIIRSETEKWFAPLDDLVGRVYHQPNVFVKSKTKPLWLLFQFEQSIRFTKNRIVQKMCTRSNRVPQHALRRYFVSFASEAINEYECNCKCLSRYIYECRKKNHRQTLIRTTMKFVREIEREHPTHTHTKIMKMNVRATNTHTHDTRTHTHGTWNEYPSDDFFFIFFLSKSSPVLFCFLLHKLYGVWSPVLLLFWHTHAHTLSYAQ